MATVGIIGGLGPESTIDYYRRILELWSEHRPQSAPSVLIDSLDVQRALRLVATDKPSLIEYLARSVERLAAGGAAFVAMTANTPHIVFDALVERSAVPLVSIVEVCAEAARHQALENVVLLGTGFTMEAPFYPEVFSRFGIRVTVPDETERSWIHERYVGQLLEGDFRDETRDQIVAIVERIRATDDVDGVILGGTELPLLLESDSVAGLPALDTTALHVEAIVSRLIALEA